MIRFRRYCHALLLLILVPVLFDACSIGPKLALPAPLQATLVDDFTAAQNNFTAAAMPAEAACMAAAVKSLSGSGTQPAQIKGLVSLGSVGYINLAQLQTLLGQGPNAIDPACLQVIGKVVVAINQMGARGLGALGGAAILAPK